MRTCNHTIYCVISFRISYIISYIISFYITLLYQLYHTIQKEIDQISYNISYIYIYIISIISYNLLHQSFHIFDQRIYNLSRNPTPPLTLNRSTLQPSRSGRNGAKRHPMATDLDPKRWRQPKKLKETNLTLWKFNLAPEK